MTQVAEKAPESSANANGTSTDAAAVQADRDRLQTELEKSKERIAGLDRQNQETLRVAKEFADLGFKSPADALAALKSVRGKPAEETPAIDLDSPDLLDENGNLSISKLVNAQRALVRDELAKGQVEASLAAQKAALEDAHKAIPAGLVPDTPEARSTVKAMIDGLVSALDPAGTNPGAVKTATDQVTKLLQAAGAAQVASVDAINDANRRKELPVVGGAGGASSTTKLDMAKIKELPEEQQLAAAQKLNAERIQALFKQQ